ncbi:MULTISPECIES: ArsR/SmtB family transcription factor [Streptomyces]|uniref:ArsR1 n=2 Tax=Streptomyces TaxID=1883 RepID=A0A0B5EWJ2_STRA4|nr:MULTISPECIES: metalloregulator ArsR/SmtB family transcription factor [Streptomyces]AJE83590.1 ArsR1 [Streptomyces albus]AOU77897.1 ArsR1 [Streptomyces albus]AYN33652.1 transcriptional regulator [Streptomyces albus]NKI41779.1 helix-turn-helix transcriptional regulator [Streptomyces physcomitrii]
MLTSADPDVIRALADPLRLQIVTLLARETLCTTHLVEETGAKQTNLSNHMKILREAGVVETEPCGRYTYYKLRTEALADLSEHFAALATSARIAAENKRACP